MIYSEIGDGSRFPTEDHIFSYAGLVPRVHQSGNEQYHGRITKVGSKYLRWILVEAARIHVPWCPESKITRHYEKLKRKRGARNRPLGIMDKLRNLRISKKRAPVERHYAALKRVFNAGHVLVTTVPRVNVKMLFTAVGFNLSQLCTLRKHGVVQSAERKLSTKTGKEGYLAL